MKKYPVAAYALALFLVPAAAFADVSVTTTPPYPDTTVNAGTRVSFSVIATGFTNPTYWVTDSFGGGANTTNIDNYGNFFWNTNISLIGTHTITIAVSDSQGNTGSATQTIVVNSGPTATFQSSESTATVGNPVSFTVTTQGMFNPTYSVSDSFNNSSLRSVAVGADGTFSWTPIAQDVGVHTVAVTTKDSFGYSATASQTITVLSTPTMTITGLTPGYTLKAGQTLSFTATTTGLVNPTYTINDAFSFATGAATIDSSGRVSWTPQPNDVGGHPFTITATDSNGRTLAASLTVTVAPGAYTPPAQNTATNTNTSSTNSASALSQTQIQAILSLLQSFGADQATINNVSSALNGQPTASSQSTASGYVFTSLLQQGMTNDEVRQLQQVLKKRGFFSGDATGYFGPMTKQAVQAFQKAHGIETAGYVGPGTRAALNSSN